MRPVHFLHWLFFWAAAAPAAEAGNGETLVPVQFASFYRRTEFTRDRDGQIDLFTGIGALVAGASLVALTLPAHA